MRAGLQPADRCRLARYPHFWAPAPADLGAEATKQFFTVTYRDGMLLGNSILIVGCAFLVVGSIQ